MNENREKYRPDSYIVVHETAGATFSESTERIASSLFELRSLAAYTNFRDKEERARFRANVVCLKTLYEAVERKVIDGNL
jgi:hypothetical protein